MKRKRARMFLLVPAIGTLWLLAACTPPPPKIRHAEIRNPKPVPKNIPFSEIELGAPQKKEHVSYLGLSEARAFKTGHIQAEILIVHAFSLYCTLCQKDAPNIQKVYETLESRNLNGRIKMIGLAVSNSAFEANQFTRKFRLQYPVFPDQDLSLALSLHIARTPAIISLVRNEDRAWEIVDFREGAVEDTDGFIEMLRSRLDG